MFAATDFVEMRLVLEWRRWLTQHLLAGYFANRTFYQLHHQLGLLDNPDQVKNLVSFDCNHAAVSCLESACMQPPICRCGALPPAIGGDVKFNITIMRALHGPLMQSVQARLSYMPDACSRCW